MTNPVASSSNHEDVVAPTFSPEADFVARVDQACRARDISVTALAETVGMSWRELSIQLGTPDILLLGTARRISQALEIPMWRDAA